MRASLIALAVLALAGCQTGPSVIGEWQIEQNGKGFGRGMDQLKWEFKDDKTFSAAANSTPVISGTYEFDGKILTLTTPSEKSPMTFRFDNNQLIPTLDGKDVAEFKLVR